MTLKLRQIPFKYLIPVFYTIAIVLMIFFQWTTQKNVRQGSGSPLYRNIMEKTAFIKRGFNSADILMSPQGDEWIRFKAPPLTVSNSGLPDLPQHSFLSPFGKPAEEYTIIVQVELDEKAIAYMENDSSVIPGIYFGLIGENWEIFFNGSLVRSEMHLDNNGQIKKRRTWRDVFFPLDKDLFVLGTNILALRIVGDPAYSVTGLYYTEPYYIDDYRIILKQHRNYLRYFFCGVLAYTGIYYLLIFLSVRKREELFNLYYSIFSLMLCINYIVTEGAINSIIPNSDIVTRLEYFSIFIAMSMLAIFIEQMVRHRISRLSRGFFIFSLFIGITQVVFCLQYGEEVMHLFLIAVLFYFSAVFISVVHSYLSERHRIKKYNGVTDKTTDTFISLMMGSLVVFACGIYDVLDVLFFRSSFRLFLYSTIVFHIGMALTLSSRFSRLYKRLEQLNVVLEKTVQDRTLELEEQTKIAIKASQAKSQFLATMSHEIRTPLNAVIGLSEIELQGELPDKTKNNINQIYQSGTLLLGIINDILDISKIEAGGFVLIPVEYETASLINDTVNLNRVRIGSKPITFILEIKGDFPKKLFGDELRVKQILNNILSNAIKYTNEGSVTLSVEWGNAPKKQIWVRFTVRDTGIGIRKNDINKIFTDFSQIDTKANRKIEGTGLGLAITEKLLEMMNGKIKVESDYGRGSCFTIELIQDFVDNKSIGEETADKLRTFMYVSDSKGKDIDHSWMPYGKVLVVDDMPTNLHVAKGLLEPYGLQVDTAASGLSAIDMILSGKIYDLIFMDHMMPGMDGIETTKAIRKYNPDLNIVALTANAVVGNKEMFLSNGFNDFISKPIDLVQLDDVLNRFIRNKQNNETLRRAEDEMTLKMSGNRRVSTNEMLYNIPGIDAAKGIASTGGTIDGYRAVLSVFCNDARDRLYSFENEVEASVFTTHVHSLKSALAAIGASQLSAKAAALEAAGHSRNWLFINGNLSGFTKDLSEMVGNIMAVLDTSGDD